MKATIYSEKAEALANVMRIVKDIENETLREPAHVSAALGHLKELGREIRENNGKTDDAANSNAPRAADSAVSR